MNRIRIELDNYTSLIESTDGAVFVTRTTVLGDIASHPIKSKYSMIEIAVWLYMRKLHDAPLIQEAFPDMRREDREFLLTGITPDKWDEVFPRGGN